MKRYDFYGEYDYYATPVEDIDGAWIRYTDHCEAMKRIAAEPPRQMVADSAQAEHIPYLPYLVDRADAVKGHYAIGRWNPAGYREVWNLHRHHWAAFSDDVLTLEQATELLRELVIPTAPGMVADSAGGAEDEDDEMVGDQRLIAWDKFPGWLIDHHEGDTITEEGLQHALADMLKVHTPVAAQPPAAAEAEKRDMEVVPDDERCRCEEPGEILEGYCQECGNKVGKSQFQATLESVARDAERYRFIKASMLILSGGHRKFGWPVSPFGEQCDRYLDAAMSASKEGA